MGILNMENLPNVQPEVPQVPEPQDAENFKQPAPAPAPPLEIIESPKPARKKYTRDPAELKEHI